MARRRKPDYYKITFIEKPGRTKQKRIIIPQTPYRPIKVRGDLLDRESLAQQPWWFVKHRRGIHRPVVGVDALEARAVSKSTVKGTLPERIVYKELLNRRMRPNFDFSFQTSEQGGRLVLGGMVADFLFPWDMFVLNVQGPTHASFLRAEKDDEQEQTLADMGYRYYEIWEYEIYNESLFDAKMDQIFDYSAQNPIGDQNGDFYMTDNQIQSILIAADNIRAGIS